MIVRECARKTGKSNLLDLIRLTGVAVFVVLWMWLARPVYLGGATSYVLVSGSSMQPTLQSGDLVITRRKERYQPGDIVAFRIPRGYTGAGRIVIHRIIRQSPDGRYITKGDNRSGEDLWRPTAKDVDGKMVWRGPRVGPILARIQHPLILGLLAALAAFFSATIPARRLGSPALRDRLSLLPSRRRDEPGIDPQAETGFDDPADS